MIPGARRTSKDNEKIRLLLELAFITVTALVLSIGATIGDYNDDSEIDVNYNAIHPDGYSGWLHDWHLCNTSDSLRKVFYELRISHYRASQTPVATSTPTVENMVLRPSPSPTLPLRDSEVESPDRYGDQNDFNTMLRRVFGAHSSKAFRVADCEVGKKLSVGYNPFWLNRTEVGLAGEVSIWQIHPVHFGKYDRERLQNDLEYAAQAAWEISGYGTNWTGPWRKCGWQ